MKGIWKILSSLSARGKVFTSSIVLAFLALVVLFQNCSALKLGLLMSDQSQAAALGLSVAPYWSVRTYGNAADGPWFESPASSCKNFAAWMTLQKGCTYTGTYVANPRSDHKWLYPGDCFYTGREGVACDRADSGVKDTYSHCVNNATDVNGICYCWSGYYWDEVLSRANDDGSGRGKCVPKPPNYKDVFVTKNLGKPKVCVANPINPMLGNKYQKEQDFSSLQTGGVEFYRTYNSLLPDDFSGDFIGAKWVHNYARRIIGDPATASIVTLVRPDGRIYTFEREGTSWSEASVKDLLTYTYAGTAISGFKYEPSESSEVEYYDQLGRLTKIEMANGLVQTLTYNGTSKKLETVQDSFGKILRFTYDPVTQYLLSVTLPDSRTIEFLYKAHDANAIALHLLDRVKMPDGRSRIYHYEDTRFKAALTGITNELGIRYVRWGYDERGRASFSEGLLASDNLQVSYEGTIFIKSATVTDNAGTVTKYEFDAFKGIMQPVQTSRSTCATCGTGTVTGTQFTYYPDGLMRTAVDSGVTTYFEWDHRGREKLRVIGYQTPKARTIQTEYHPTFNKVQRVTETQTNSVIPGAFTDLVAKEEYAYDPTTGDLLEEKISSDGGNSFEIRTYTYHSPGLLKSETSGNSTTTYAYYASDAGIKSGMLKSQTDSQGRITQFDYNPQGKLFKVISPENVISTFTYTPSGKMKTVSTDYVTPDATRPPSVTVYDYDTTDRLKLITQPNGEKVNYVYMDASSDRIKEVVMGNLTGAIRVRVIYHYNTKGEVFKKEYRDGANNLVKWESEEDRPDNKTWTWSDNAGRTETINYDDFRRPLSRVSAFGKSDFYYDELSNLKEWTSNSTTTRYQMEYASNSVPLKFTDAKGTTTNFYYDGLSRLLRIQGLDWGQQNFQHFNGTGMLKAHTDHVTDIVYDNLQRETHRSFKYSDGSVGNIETAYLPAPKQGVDGVKVSKAGVLQVETKYLYDVRGRVLREITNLPNPVTGANHALNVVYRYNAGDEVSGMNYISGARVDYTLVEGQIKELKMYRSNGALLGTLNNITYDALGRLKAWGLSGTALTHTRTYDSVKQNLKTLDYAPSIYRRDFANYDNKDQMTRIYSYRGGEFISDISLTYDDQGRVKQTDNGSRDYDLNGNVTRIVRNVATDWSSLPPQTNPPLTITETIPVAVRSGLVGHWKFDESTYNGTVGEVKDLSGSDRHGKLSGAMTTIPGIFGKSLDTAKFPMRYLVVDPAKMPATNDAFTAQVWIRTTDRTPWKGIMARRSFVSNVANGWLLSMGNGDGKVFIRLDTSAGQNQGGVACSARKATDPVVADGRWHLIGVSVDKGTCKLYIDGVKYADGAYNHGLGFTNSDFRVYGHLIGQVDEVAYWNRQMAPTEATQAYAVINETPFNNTYISTGVGSTKSSVFGTFAGSNRLAINPASNPVDVVRDGLLGYWKFEQAAYTGAAGQVIDSSGLNRHGQMTLASTPVPGAFGKAINTVASAARLKIAAAQLPASNESFTAQMWIKSTDTTPYQGLMSRMNYGVNPIVGWTLQIGNGDGRLFLRIDTSAGANQTGVCSARRSSDPVVTDGQWHHVAVVMNNGNCKLYIDGVKYGDGNYARGNGFVASTDLLFTGPVKGSYDEAAIWARPLSDAEIRQNYRSIKTSQSLAYNLDGHQITNPSGGVFKYNSLGEMEGFGNYSYIYNHKSLRVAKLSNSVIPTAAQFTIYSFDREGKLLGEYDKMGYPLYEVFYLGDVPVAVLRGNILHLVAADQVNAPRVVYKTTSPYEVVWTWDDEIFGDEPANQLVRAASSSAILNPFLLNLRFPGQVFDMESGLHYNVSRYYEPATGRYLQGDRIGLDGGANPYIYASANPLQAIDPTGEASVNLRIMDGPTRISASDTYNVILPRMMSCKKNNIKPGLNSNDITGISPHVLSARIASDPVWNKCKTVYIHACNFTDCDIHVQLQKKLAELGRSTKVCISNFNRAPTYKTLKNPTDSSIWIMEVPGSLWDCAGELPCECREQSSQPRPNSCGGSFNPKSSTTGGPRG